MQSNFLNSIFNEYYIKLNCEVKLHFSFFLKLDGIFVVGELQSINYNVIYNKIFF